MSGASKRWKRRVSPEAQPLANYEAALIDDLRSTLAAVDFTHAAVLRRQLDLVEQGDGARDLTSGALCLLTGEALGVDSRFVRSAALTLGLLSLSAAVLRGLMAPDARPAGSLESAWGMPRTLNAGDAFYVLAQQAFSRLNAHDLAAHDVIKASRYVRSAARLLCDDLLLQGLDASRQPIDAALALAALGSGASEETVDSLAAGDRARLETLKMTHEARERLQAALE
jgi:hypothetical protein